MVLSSAECRPPVRITAPGNYFSLIGINIYHSIFNFFLRNDSPGEEEKYLSYHSRLGVGREESWKKLKTSFIGICIRFGSKLALNKLFFSRKKMKQLIHISLGD